MTLIKNSALHYMTACAIGQWGTQMSDANFDAMCKRMDIVEAAETVANLSADPNTDARDIARARQALVDARAALTRWWE